LIGALHPWKPFENTDPQAVLHPTWSGGKLYTPISDHLNAVLRDQLRAVVPENNRYIEVFDRFECLLGMVLADLHEHRASQGYVPSMHVGSFGWRYRHGRSGSPWDWVQAELSSQGDGWPILGLFGGDRKRLEAALSAVVEATKRRDWGW